MTDNRIILSLNSEGSYQSFTTGNVDHISQIGLNLYTGGGTADRPITVRIRTGTGTGGDLIGTATATPTINATPTFYIFTLNIPAIVSSNTVYSISAFYSDSSGSGIPWWSEQTTTDGYAGGRNNESASYDCGFKTFYSTGRGMIGTSAGTVSKIIGFATDAKSLTIKDTLL